MFKIGNIEIKGVTALAPMAGVCNNAFREICKEHGASLIYAEMVNERAIVYQNKKTLAMTKVSSKEHPIALQIFGSDIDSFIEAAKYCDKYSDCDIIDINMGCPVPKVAISAQAGAALLKDPAKVFEIVNKIVTNVSKPVTVKIRTGWDEDSINCVEIAKIIEKAGALAIAVHGRTRNQQYTGKANWDLIKQVKNAVKIPVIGNGDIFSAEDAQRMLNETGVDAVMIARGAQGNPWIFNQVENFINKKQTTTLPTQEEVVKTIIDHTDRLIKIKDERTAILEMRGHIGHYLRHVKVKKEFKIKVVQINSRADLINCLEAINQFVL